MWNWTNMENKIVNTYLRQSICLIVGLTLLFLLYMNVWGNADVMTVPIVVSAVFQLVACIAYAFVWKAVAASSTESLPTLYLTASGCRMFAGIVTVLAYCFASEDKAAIRFFVIAFLIYYFIILIYDTAYFMKVEKKIRQNA